VNAGFKGKLLVSCCNKDGGLYSIEYIQGHYQWAKVHDGNFRGIDKYGDQYLVASGKSLLLLDARLREISNKSFTGTDFHGVVVRDSLGYVVDTKRNAVRIFRLPELIEENQIRFATQNRDVIHLNDLSISDDRLFVSMFSRRPLWKEMRKAGCIVEYSLSSNKIKKILYDRLEQPHSIKFHNGRLYYCNSMKGEVRKGNEILFRGPLYTRGLNLCDRYMTVGHSMSRHQTQQKKTAGSCGITFFDLLKNKAEKFIALPSQEVYDILIVETRR
jgi:hypothetical protein